MDELSPPWHPQRFAGRMERLRARGRVKAAVRHYFETRGFLEVETPILQVSPGNETHIGALPTRLTGPDGAARPLYLHTSPEFACKKLLAAGVERLFTLAPVFRDRERGRLHHPEFTMLEWYRAGSGLEALVDDCAAILRLAAEATGSPTLQVRRPRDRFSARRPRSSRSPKRSAATRASTLPRCSPTIRKASRA